MEQLIQFIPEVEEDRRITMYELAKNAHAGYEAERMIQARTDYFASLYDDIRFFSVKIDPFAEGSGSPAVEVQALDILDTKQAYDRRIVKLQERYSRWKGLLSSFNEHEADLLKRYFEEGDKIPLHTIERVLKKAGKQFEDEEALRGRSLDARAMRQYREQYQSETRAKSPSVNEGKQQYLIRGRFVYLSPEEYKEHQEKEAARMRRFQPVANDRG